jgi:hypothetical protein
VVAVLGSLDEHDQRLLAGVAASGRSAYAVVVGVGTATLDLRRSGWRAVTLTQDGSLPLAWSRLTGTGAPAAARTAGPGAGR